MIEQGRMAEAGLATVREAKENGEWFRMPINRKELVIPKAMQQALAKKQEGPGKLRQTRKFLQTSVRVLGISCKERRDQEETGDRSHRPLGTATKSLDSNSEPMRKNYNSQGVRRWIVRRRSECLMMRWIFQPILPITQLERALTHCSWVSRSRLWLCFSLGFRIPSELRVQVVLFALAVLFHVLGFLLFIEEAVIAYCVRVAPQLPEGYKGSTIRYLSDFVWYTLTGITFLMFFVWGLHYLALVTAIVAISLIV